MCNYLFTCRCLNLFLQAVSAVFYLIAYCTYTPPSSNNDLTMPLEENMEIVSHTEHQQPFHSITHVGGINNHVFEGESTTAIWGSDKTSSVIVIKPSLAMSSLCFCLFWSILVPAYQGPSVNVLIQGLLSVSVNITDGKNEHCYSMYYSCSWLFKNRLISIHD